MGLAKLNSYNYESYYLEFQDRQAGISLVYCPLTESYSYNAYCIDKKIYRELFSVEYDFLEDALQTVNEEFGTWDLVAFTPKKSCGDCAAKK